MGYAELFLCIITCCKQTFRKAFGYPFSLHACPTVLPTGSYYSSLDLVLCTLACLQPFLLNRRKQFTASNPSVGPVGTFLHWWWQLRVGAMHRETADWWGGRGRRGSATALRTRHMAQEDQKEFEKPSKGLFQFSWSHHRKVKEKKQYNGDG